MTKSNCIEYDTARQIKMNKQVKILYDRTLTFDGISYKTKVTKPTNSQFAYNIKSAVKVNGKTFVDYRNHTEWGTAANESFIVNEQLWHLFTRLDKHFPNLPNKEWYLALSDYFLPQNEPCF